MKSLSTRSFEYNYSAHVKILLFNRDKQDKRDNIKIKSLLNLSQKVSNLLEFKSLYPVHPVHPCKNVFALGFCFVVLNNYL